MRAFEQAEGRLKGEGGPRTLLEVRGPPPKEPEAGQAVPAGQNVCALFEVPLWGVLWSCCLGGSAWGVLGPGRCVLSEAPCGTPLLLASPKDLKDCEAFLGDRREPRDASLNSLRSYLWGTGENPEVEPSFLTEPQLNSAGPNPPPPPFLLRVLCTRPSAHEIKNRLTGHLCPEALFYHDRLIGGGGGGAWGIGTNACVLTRRCGDPL